MKLAQAVPVVPTEYLTFRTDPSAIPNWTTPGCLLLSRYQYGSGPPLVGCSRPQAVGNMPAPIHWALTFCQPVVGGPLLAYSPNRNVLLVPSLIVARACLLRLE